VIFEGAFVSGYCFMRILKAIFFVLFFLFSIQQSLSSKKIDLPASCNNFACDIYKQVSGEDGNICISPFSIHSTLAMTYAGACGTTAEQMAKVLHFSEVSQEQLHLSYGKFIRKSNIHDSLIISNRLFGNGNFLDSFLNLLENNYGAGLDQINFADRNQACDVINNWVRQASNDLIKEIVNPGLLPVLPQLVLVNTIYFKGKWDNPFYKKNTKEKKFGGPNNKEFVVSMMYQKNCFKYKEEGDFQVLELPYKDDKLSMVVVLPKKKDGIYEFESNLSSENLNKWLSELEEQTVEVYLPKFKIESNFNNLAKHLIDMGMQDAFDDMSADFSGMTGNKGLSIYRIIHKAIVDVYEEGAEAAAATAVIMGARCCYCSLENPIFNANHPFIYFIKDNESGLILFMGRFENP